MTTERKKSTTTGITRGAFYVPAGLLIGLGIGMLAGYPGPGLMIGLGLGFIGSAILKPKGYPGSDTAAPAGYGRVPMDARRSSGSFSLSLVSVWSGHLRISGRILVPGS